MIGGKAMDAIARQPEAAESILIGMILAAALIEGAALIAILLLLYLYRLIHELEFSFFNSLKAK
ncbi:MAG: ATP synthase F0 subunit C [Chitinophagales bacterium]